MISKIKGLGLGYHPSWLASAIFKHAINTGHAVTNPIRDADVLGRGLEKGETGSYTLEEAEDIITALVDNLQAQVVMVLAFFLGLRKSEIAALKWSDVDDHAVHVRRSLSRGIVGPPKSKKSVRSIPLIRQVRDLLALWRSKKIGNGVKSFPTKQ